MGSLLEANRKPTHSAREMQFVLPRNIPELVQELTDRTHLGFSENTLQFKTFERSGVES